MDQKFKKAVAEVLRFEGGYVNDPDDPGGETKFGISKRAYPDLDIKALRIEEAIEIYRRDWWDRYRYGEIRDDDLAAKVMSCSVNLGPARAHRLLQRANNYSGGDWVDVDGIIGSLTLAAVNNHPSPGCLLAAFKLLVVEYYADKADLKYLRGLIRRAVK